MTARRDEGDLGPGGAQRAGGREGLGADVAGRRLDGLVDGCGRRSTGEHRDDGLRLGQVRGDDVGVVRQDGDERVLAASTTLRMPRLPASSTRP